MLIYTDRHVASCHFSQSLHRSIRLLRHLCSCKGRAPPVLLFLSTVDPPPCITAGLARSRPPLTPDRFSQLCSGLSAKASRVLQAPEPQAPAASLHGCTTYTISPNYSRNIYEKKQPFRLVASECVLKRLKNTLQLGPTFYCKVPSKGVGTPLGGEASEQRALLPHCGPGRRGRFFLCLSRDVMVTGFSNWLDGILFLCIISVFFSVMSALWRVHSSRFLCFCAPCGCCSLCFCWLRRPLKALRTARSK